MQDALPLCTPETFPWPVAPDGMDQGSTYGIVEAMQFPGLTPAERCAAIFVGDGAGGSAYAIRSLATALEISEDDVMELLWNLLRKGFLTRVAYWWSR